MKPRLFSLKFWGIPRLAIFVVSNLALVVACFILVNTFLLENVVDYGELISSKNKIVNGLFRWIMEIAGWSSWHHLKDVLFAEYYASTVFNLITDSTICNLFVVASAFLLNVGACGVWESFEKWIVWIFQVLHQWAPNSKIVNKFIQTIGTGEPIYNTLLADQSVHPILTMAGVTYMVLYLKIQMPSVLNTKKWNMTFVQHVVRFGAFCFFGFNKAASSYKIVLGDGTKFPLGLYACFFFDVWLWGIMYLNDFYTVRKYELEKEEDVYLVKSKMNYIYVFNVVYFVGLYIFTLNLTLPGLITSNILWIALMVAVTIIRFI
jgi:hypothetical protein